MRVLLKIAMVLLAGFWQQTVVGQVYVDAKLDSNAILIGQQTKLHLSLSSPEEVKVFWPEIADTITENIELIKKSNPAQKKGGDGSLIVSQTLTITSFDSGYFAIPPIVVGYQPAGRNDTLYSESEALLLGVNNVPVNLQGEIKDIKGPKAAPFTFREALPWILAFLVTALITIGIIYYLRKRKKKEPVFRAPPKPAVPPHTAALDALETLRFKKLWQNGEIKQYHTELTDIMREYLWRQFNIHALEFTSDEILESIKHLKVNEEVNAKLQQTLFMADMVKFAKMQPLPVEHDSSLNNAIDFVNETKHIGRESTSGKEVHNV